MECLTRNSPNILTFRPAMTIQLTFIHSSQILHTSVNLRNPHSTPHLYLRTPERSDSTPIR